MEKLVSHGANVNLSNRKGVSALMEAVKQAALEDSSSLKTIDMLLSAEADPNVCDEEGRTALDRIEELNEPRLQRMVAQLLKSDDSGRQGVLKRAERMAIDGSEYTEEKMNAKQRQLPSRSQRERVREPHRDDALRGGRGGAKGEGEDGYTYLGKIGAKEEGGGDTKRPSTAPHAAPISAAPSGGKVPQLYLQAALEKRDGRAPEGRQRVESTGARAESTGTRRATPQGVEGEAPRTAPALQVPLQLAPPQRQLSVSTSEASVLDVAEGKVGRRKGRGGRRHDADSEATNRPGNNIADLTAEQLSKFKHLLGESGDMS
jgi:hypothetical protein